MLKFYAVSRVLAPVSKILIVLGIPTHYFSYRSQPPKGAGIYSYIVDRISSSDEILGGATSEWAYM